MALESHRLAVVEKIHEGRASGQKRSRKSSTAVKDRGPTRTARVDHFRTTNPPPHCIRRSLLDVTRTNCVLSCGFLFFGCVLPVLPISSLLCSLRAHGLYGLLVTFRCTQADVRFELSILSLCICFSMWYLMYSR